MTWDEKPSRRGLAAFLLRCMHPPERLKKSEWAERRRRMSAESSAQKGGRFTFRLAPWQREPMDQIDNLECSAMVLMWASQTTGKSETILNIIGAMIDTDPCPMLMVQPNERPMAEDWSKGRLAPAIRDTPSLVQKVQVGRNSDNTIFRKSFPGGFLAIGGANSPASLASRPVRVCFFDEVDRYPTSAGTEGDPIALGEKRTESYEDSFTIKASTPTTKGLSRIEKDFEETDKRYWFCPCPVCGHWQILKWEQVDFSKHGTTTDPVYICASDRRCVLDDCARQKMVRAGEWRPTAEFKGVRGYHISGVYCLFRPKRRFKNRLVQMVAEFLSANSKGNETLKVWWNTFKAETWEDPAEKPPAAITLFERRENYLTLNDDQTITIPEQVLCIVAGGDNQADRVELEVVGYGHGEEAWALGNIIVAGDPQLPETWERVDAEFARKFRHPSGAHLEIACALIDRKYKGKVVDEFTRPRNSRRIYSCYGSSAPQQPIVSTPTRQGPRRTVCFRIGTDTAKGVLYSRLRLLRPGPRYLHFPEGFGYDLEYFEQLVSEREQTEWKEGKVTRKWIKTRARNEALDKRVYAMAALEVLRPNFDALAKNLAKVTTKKEYALTPPTPPTVPALAQIAQRPPRRTGKSFVGGWR